MLAAVDTNFLLGLACSDNDTLDALETLRDRAPHFLVSATPTPLQELRFFKEQSLDARLKAAAAKALANFKTIWGFRAALLTRIQNERVEKSLTRSGQPA